MAEMEAHLRMCTGCSAELEEHRALSKTLGGVRQEPMTGDELERIHNAVDQAADRTIFRFAAGLSAVAASILIIGSAWLYDSPQPGAVRVADFPQARESWEQLAIGRPPESIDTRQTDFARTKEASNWMAANLQMMGRSTGSK